MLLLIGLLALTPGGRSRGAEVGRAPDPERGLYAVWARDDVFKLPYIHGGQIVLQWAELEPAEGQYDFAPLAAELKACRERKMRATLQVNGNRKPQWLYRKVPRHPERLSIQVADRQGTLMYWHPAFERAYLNFLAAYADFLKASPDRDVVLGLRLNFNGMGTEHLDVPPRYRAPEQWITPPGAEPGPAFREEFKAEYTAKVVDAFVERFSPFTRVFVRNNIGDEIEAKYRGLFESGKLGWFQTGSEMEPRGMGVERGYVNFLEYCRPGKALGYAEPWADAWGYHGGKRDPRWCSPPQWNYWRLLSDLNMGISFIAIYGEDLEVALSGRHKREAVPEYKAEFDKAFAFAAKYAGYHASPEVAPGAWVAFRQSEGEGAGKAPLQRVTGDYTFLMERLPDATEGERNVGPAGQRYGAWARRLAPADRMRLRINEAFVKSVAGREVSVNVTYLDEGSGALELAVGGKTFQAPLQGSGAWKTASFTVSGGALRPDEVGAQLALEARGDAVALHMVEVARR